jgi:serine/threonine protein kinase
VKANDAGNDVTLTATYNMKGASQRPRPARVGRYQLGEMLGRGAMGVVYRAHDPDLDRAVAIKVVRAGHASSGTRLLREAQAMARLRHHNVVPIFDVGPAEDAVFVVMPLIEGSTLGQWLRGGAKNFDEILDRFLAAGRGLAAAHAAGLVHRDFKPDNVLLDNRGEIQVSDFGLACLAHEEVAPSSSARTLASGAITETGDILGTPPYMAPEQLRGRPSDERADQFSFCVSLWEGIYGERPFADPPSDTDQIPARLAAIAAGPVPPAQRRVRPARLMPVLVRGLAADPDRRWPTMDALLDAIAAQRAPRRWPRQLAMGAGLTAIVTPIAFLLRSPPPPPSPRGVVQITHRVDLSNAAISPDGTKLAFIAGESLMLRGIAPDVEDRVLVDQNIADRSLSWSPDGKRLLVEATPEVVDRLQTELVDLDGGVQYKLPAPGLSAFLSNDRVVVAEYRQHSVQIFPLGPHATAVASCEVPGDYTFIENLAGMPDGTMIVETLTGDTHKLVILDSDCHVRATFSAKQLSGIALSDAGTVVTLVRGDGFGEILEVSLDGAVLSRRRVSGELDRVIGRHGDADYVLTLALKTHLDRVHPKAPPARRSSTLWSAPVGAPPIPDLPAWIRAMPPPMDQFSVNGSAVFSRAPNDDTLAWIELGGRFRPRGPLRLSTLPDLARRGHRLLDRTVSVGWSPDGQSLAALVDDDPGSALVILDRDGHIARRWPLSHVDLTAQPVWLNDRRIACRTDDFTTYHWFDLKADRQGDITDRTQGSIYWLTPSPRDGTLAMWRLGKPGTIDAYTDHLWLMSPGHAAAPFHVDEATRYHLLPSWTPSGELLVRALETGVVSQVDLTTHKLTPIARLSVMSLKSSLNHEHLSMLPDGDLLVVDTEPGMNVSVVRSDDERPQRPPGEHSQGAL